ncbi:MAG: hypothetical protein ACRC62_21425, partial [Microcoleus sp.]
MSRARDLLNLQNLIKADRYQSDQEKLRESQRSNKQWRWVGFDATTGQGIVRSGSEERRGKVLTNGTIVPGQLVDYNEVDGFGTIKSTPRSRPEPKPKPKKHVKKKKLGEKIALYYKPSQRDQAEIGAIGEVPIVVGETPLPIGTAATTVVHVTKTAEGWIAHEETGTSVSRLFTGDAFDITETLANGKIPVSLEQTHTALGYKSSANRQTPVGYGYRSVGRVVIQTPLPFSIQTTFFADGTPSDFSLNVTKNATWLEGFVDYGVPTVDLNSATMTKQTSSGVGGAIITTISG